MARHDPRWVILPERPGDAEAIREVTRAAFEGMALSDGTEPTIPAGLRAAGALAVSLVALEGRAVVGHAAFSPVTIDGADPGWFGLGPVSVRPDRQRRGIGTALIRRGLARLDALGAGGCVVLGDPGYYGRFGFEADPALVYAGAPSRFFQRLVIAPPPPTGEVRFHPAFGG